MNRKSINNLSQFIAKSSLAGLMACFVGGCASMTTAPNTQHSATVKIQQVSAAYYGSATKGQGTLYFEGRRTNFTISSVGVGGTGGLKINATGKVFGLNRLSDFSGKYRGVSRGLTLFEGKMHAKLSNENGVTIYLTGATEGLASSAGVQTYQINLDQ